MFAFNPRGHTYIHPFNGPLSGTTRVSRYQKGKTNLDFTEATDNEWQWHQLGHMQVCISLQTDNHASTPPLKFFTFRMHFLPPNHQHQSTEGKQSQRAWEHEICTSASGPQNEGAETRWPLSPMMLPPPSELLGLNECPNNCINECLVSKLVDGGLPGLHSADDDAVSWLCGTVIKALAE